MSLQIGCLQRKIDAYTKDHCVKICAIRAQFIHNIAQVLYVSHAYRINS